MRNGNSSTVFKCTMNITYYSYEISTSTMVMNALKCRTLLQLVCNQLRYILCIIIEHAMKRTLCWTDVSLVWAALFTCTRQHDGQQ